MNERQLNYFCTIAKEKSIQKASKILGKNPSTLTRTVRSMEEEIGVQLFERSREGNCLTKEGTVTYQFACRVLSMKKSEFGSRCWTDQEIKYLLSIYETGKISLAAEKMYVSQPSLSQKLWQIEKELKQTLFVREKKGVHITDYGSILIGSMMKIREEYRKYEAEIERYQKTKTGKISIGIPMNLGTSLLPSLLPDFVEKYPDISIHIREGNSSELEQFLNEKKVDFCIMHEYESGEEISRESILEDPFYLVVPKKMKRSLNLNTGHALTMDDLKKFENLPFIMVARRQKLRQVSDQILKLCKITPKIRCTTKSMETAKRLTAQGMGITFLPRSYLTLYSGNENLIYYPLDADLHASWKLVMTHLNDGNLSGCAKEFLKYMDRYFHSLNCE
ncbi:LysR substrate-binding domain-containing protein [Blautia glucerasea]|uniref:LysR substrate-binding domain-containing protein n=1 Tax=Blautia glucerasea TaxID=536633 RepID=UPI001D060EA7|nr:LysR substrate-binding domain-containing protein [Blautia glucerasea]MCB6544866.1 LysR family transcriptional regulator [Blautia glucerasea]